jgi:hypothetical protein
VWALFALVAVSVAVTYARLPPERFFNVSEGGIAGGLGRALVFLNFPTALAALALVAVAADRLRGHLADGLALLAALLCLAVAVPGVVEEDDLDAKAANAVPALGVALALGLTLAGAAGRGLVRPAPWQAADWARLAVGVVAALAAVPWLVAELGFYVSDLPGLGAVFLAEEVVPEPGRPQLRAVHLGHHHGLDGVLFALTALALSRELPRLRRPRLRLVLAAYLSLMLVYGLANALQDFWLEQLWKRDAVAFRFPDLLRPGLRPEWAAIVVASAAVYAFLLRPTWTRRP